MFGGVCFVDQPSASITLAMPPQPVVIARRAAMAVTETIAITKPYSIAVPPCWSRRNRVIVRIAASAKAPEISCIEEVVDTNLNDLRGMEPHTDLLSRASVAALPLASPPYP